LKWLRESHSRDRPKQIRLELSRIEDAIDNLGNEVRGRLRIGTSEHIGSNHLPTILRSFHSNYPEVEIDLRVTSTAQTLASVENSSLELALCVMNGRTHRSLPPKLRGMEVWTDALQIVVAKNHPLATGAAVPLNVLIDTPAILAPITTPVRTTVDDELLAHELTATVAVEAGDFETMSSMTSMGLGWSCLPQHQVNDNLAVLDVQELKLKHSVALVRRDNRTLSRAAQAFLDSLRQLLGPGFNTTSPIEH